LETKRRLKGVRLKKGAELTKTLISRHIQDFCDEIKLCGDEYCVPMKKQVQLFCAGLSPKMLRVNVRLVASDQVYDLRKTFRDAREVADRLIGAAALWGLKIRTDWKENLLSSDDELSDDSSGEGDWPVLEDLGEDEEDRASDCQASDFDLAEEIVNDGSQIEESSEDQRGCPRGWEPTPEDEEPEDGSPYDSSDEGSHGEDQSQNEDDDGADESSPVLDSSSEECSAEEGPDGSSDEDSIHDDSDESRSDSEDEQSPCDEGQDEDGPGEPRSDEGHDDSCSSSEDEQQASADEAPSDSEDEREETGDKGANEDAPDESPCNSEDGTPTDDDEEECDRESHSGDEEADEEPRLATMGRVRLRSPSLIVNKEDSHCGVRRFQAKPGRLKTVVKSQCAAELVMPKGWYLSKNGCWQQEDWLLRNFSEAGPREVSVPKEEHHRGPAWPPDDRRVQE
jgi:hypothetical protein